MLETPPPVPHPIPHLSSARPWGWRIPRGWTARSPRLGWALGAVGSSSGQRLVCPRCCHRCRWCLVTAWWHAESTRGCPQTSQCQGSGGGGLGVSSLRHRSHGSGLGFCLCRMAISSANYTQANHSPGLSSFQQQCAPLAARWSSCHLPCARCPSRPSVIHPL